MSETLAPDLELERVLSLKTVREPTSRAQFLAAVREHGKEGAPFTLQRLERLMRVEEHFQALLLYDQIEFLRQPSALSEADREFALGIQRICLEAANGFQRFLRHRNEWATTREALDAMFRVTGLALNSIHCFVKWGYFLNEPGRIVPWKQIHALHVLAENDGYSTTPFVLHPAQPSFKPTVQSLYLRTLILDMLNTGNLTRIQAEVADGWFCSWCGDYSLDSAYQPGVHLFHVDVSADDGMRLMREDSHGEALRYVRVDALKAQIEEVQAGLRHGRLFAGYGAGAVFPVEQHAALLALIEKFHDSILSGSENRIEERTHFEDREVDAILGIETIMRKVRQGPEAPAPAPIVAPVGLAETIEITPAGLSMVAPEGSSTAGAPAQARDPDVERWRVHDLSSGGYGLIVDRGTAEAVPLNGLIALRNHQTGGWIVGSVVRKLANRVRGEMLVGVEVLSYRPLAIDLDGVDGGSTTPALYLPGTDPNGKRDSLLVRSNEFRPENTFTIRAGGSAYRIRLNRIIRKGSDWIKARFEIESKG